MYFVIEVLVEIYSDVIKRRIGWPSNNLQVFTPYTHSVNNHHIY